MPTVPADAKKPQDRKPKKTSTVKFKFEGVEYEIAGEAITDDFEVIEYLAEDRTLPLAVKKILGDAQWSRYKESVRDESGRIPAQTTADFMEAMFGSVEDANLS